MNHVLTPTVAMPESTADGVPASDDCHRSDRLYAISRIRNKGGASGATSDLWHYQVSLTRQNRALAISFPDNIYGGAETALAMAVACRDAVLRLLPPVTVLQRSHSASTPHCDDGPGVGRIVSDGLAYWVARVRAAPQNRQRMFSVRRYGEEQARAMALATRAQWLHEREERFLTVHPQATVSAHALFAEHLQPGTAPAQAMPAQQVAHLVHELQAWFKAMRPLHVHVNACVYEGRPPHPGAACQRQRLAGAQAAAHLVAVEAARPGRRAAVGLEFFWSAA